MAMMTRIFHCSLFLLFTFLCVQQIHAQRFRAGVVAGLNASQIRGDDTGGYNKLGLVVGLRGIVVLTDRADLSIELLYSERGSKNDNSEPVDIEIDLTYAEVPVLFNFKDWYIEDDDYYKVQASIGFSFARLLDATSEGSTSKYIDEVDNFTENDFSFVIGAEFFFNRHFGIGARWNSSFNKLFQNENAPGKNELRGYFISFRTAYIF